ncbi:MAG: Crp/Fnr family transcriptional regulator [Chloroflexi bacterium]|nr:Crp/Fnr family transcriptional regulator [Chloroflexota bacterium]
MQPEPKQADHNATGQPTALSAVKLVPCFCCLAPQLLDRAVSATTVRRYQKGEALFHRNEPCTGLFVLRRGVVKLFRLSPDGRETTVRVAHRGECLDCVPLLDEGPNPITAQALTDAEADLLPRDGFRWLLDQDPRLAQHISRMLAVRLRYFLTRIDDFGSDIEKRMDRLLLDLARPDESKTPVVPFSQEELACLVGVSRQRLNMHLGQLQKRGIITKSRCEIRVADSSLLEESVAE